MDFKTTFDERLRQKIRVVLKSKSGDKKLLLPVPIQRGDFSRGELLGRIGMIPIKSEKRFGIAYTHTADFLAEVQRVQQSEGEDTITIPCEPHEIEQFKE